MVIARVRGTVVSTHKSPSLEGLSLLLLERIDPINLQGKGDYVVAVDSVGADTGEIVFFVAGSSARLTEATKGKPSDATVVAVIDLIEAGGRYTYDKAGPG
ncbi:MAG TPA: EutN/CcmL family microcompartment protein [Magnetospirillaceae bacterium]|nr:EutN/CcmL family microcompartment protein [Magnetospirillaceae bacterium]